MTDASEPPRAAGVAAGIADADRVGVNAKAQAANPIIKSLVPPLNSSYCDRQESFGASQSSVTHHTGCSGGLSVPFATLAERCIQRSFIKATYHWLAHGIVELIGGERFPQAKLRLHDEDALCLSKTTTRTSRMIVLTASGDSKSPQLTSLS